MFFQYIKEINFKHFIDILIILLFYLLKKIF